MLDSKGRSNNRKLADKRCAHCGGVFRPLRSSSSYCSVPCARVKNGGKNKKDESWWVNSRGYVEGRVLIDGVIRHVKQHRHLMAIHIGRDISPEEDVHHINGNKADNRIENLEILTRSKHATEHNKSRIYAKGYRLNLSQAERDARSERMKRMRRAAIAKAVQP